MLLFGDAQSAKQRSGTKGNGPAAQPSDESTVVAIGSGQVLPDRIFGFLVNGAAIPLSTRGEFHQRIFREILKMEVPERRSRKNGISHR